MKNKSAVISKQRGRSPWLIVFDVGNVLLRFDLNVAARKFERWEPGKGEKLCRALWCSPLSERFETGRLTGRQLFALVKKLLRLRISYAQFCHAFNEIFTPIRPNLRLLKKLARRWTVALLSNTNCVHWKYVFQKYPDLRHAHWPFSSHQLGRVKPDPKIYQALSRKTGYPMDRMLFIDDKLENVTAARRLGMKTVWFKNSGSLQTTLTKWGLLSKNGGARG